MIPVRGLNNSQSQDPPDCQEQIKQMWANVPTFCRFIFISVIGVYLMSFVTPEILGLLVTIPFPIIYKFQGINKNTKFLVWRIFTGPFVHTDLIQLLFSLMSYMPTAMQYEKIEGTIKQAHRFFLNSILIEVLFVISCFALSQTYSQAYILAQSIGLWPILFCDITIECNKSPDLARGLCCLPIQIKSKYYPWALLAIFSLFFGFRLDLFIGLAVGYLNILGYLKKLDVSIHRAKIWEAKYPFKLYAQQPHFVSADASAGLPTFVRTAPPQQNSAARSQPAQTQQPNQFSAFQGRGVALGGASSGTSSSSSSTSSKTNTSKSSYGSTSTNTSTSSSTQLTNEQRARSLVGQSKLIDQKGNTSKVNDSANTTLDGEDNVGHPTGGSPAQQYLKVRNNTSDDDIEVNLK